MKQCSKCKQTKGLDNFLWIGKHHRYDSWCRSCKSKVSSEWAKRRTPAQREKMNAQRRQSQRDAAEARGPVRVWKDLEAVRKYIEGL